MVEAWTTERIRALAPESRAKLYTNARSIGTPEGDAVAKLIEDAGLPFSEEACVGLDDPVVVKMGEIIFSADGRAAAVKATSEDLPALAGVDPLIAEALGVDYGKHNMTTHTAGALVADLMRHMGYVELGRSAKTPPGCVAKSGQVWRKKGG